MIELKALGGAEIRTDVATLTPSQGIVFATALYMVVERGKPVSRARLAEIIWPDIPQSTRAHRLRQTILQLRKLGFGIQADRDTLLIDGGNVLADLEHFGDARIKQTQGSSLEFLPGYSPVFSIAFEEWLDGVRNAFQSAAVAALVGQINGARQRGEWQYVDTVSANCLSIDPYNEEAVLAKAEAAAMRGSKRRAVAILDDYISEMGNSSHELKLPATILRRRVLDRIPDRPNLSNDDPPFVGREEEMSALTNALQMARAGKGSAVLLVGEPGIGKTRVCAELARVAELRGARVERARCRRTDLDRPLSLFVDIVPQLRDLPGALGCAPETLLWLKRLTEFEQHRNEASRNVETERLFENLRAALFDLLEAIAHEHCLVIVIEDVQWLDKASASLLAAMVDWCVTRRVFFLFNARSDQNAVSKYADEISFRTVVIGPLADTASKSLLTYLTRASGESMDPLFLDWCLTVAEGNPFFLQELVHQWIETGERSDAPQSIDRVLQERLSRLSADALQVLQASALLNDFATLDRVERVLAYPPHQLLLAIEELSKAAMLQYSADAAEGLLGQLRPKHDFLALAAVRRLSPVSQAFLHRRCATTLETELAHERVSPTLLWACATHRHESGDHELALGLRVSCADHLLEMGLVRDACVTYSQTLNYCAIDSDRLRVLSRLARALELEGASMKSIETLRTCMELAGRLTQGEGRHNDYELLMLEARHRTMLDFAPLLEDALDCVKCSHATPKHRLGAAVLAMKLAVDFGRIDLLDMIYRQVSPFFDDEAEELRRLEIETIYRTMRGEDVPVVELTQLAETARKVNGDLAYCRSLAMASTACRLSARYEEGLSFATRALEHATANRFYSTRREILLWTIPLHIAANKIAAARTVLTAIQADTFTTDSAKDRNEVLLFDTRIAIEEGDYSRAAAAFKDAEPVSPAYSYSRRCYCLALEIRLKLHARAPADTLRPLVESLEDLTLKLKGASSRDFETYTLFLGLSAVGEGNKGRQLLSAYVARRGRTWPLPQWIVEAQTTITDHGERTSGQDLEARSPSTYAGVA